MNLNLQVSIWRDEDGFYIISCPALKGCRSYGVNIEEAYANIKEAIQVHLEYLKDTARY